MKNKYKQQIHPDFRIISQHIPFNTFVIRMASIVQTYMFKMTPIPKTICNRRFSVKGFSKMEVPVDIFEPEHTKQKIPCLLYIHGGGFGYKAAPHHKKLACLYAKEANCRVIFPDYHLLPKYVFPAAYVDVRSVYEWVCNHTEELLIDEKRIAVAGDSAGAALAANLCNTAERNSLPVPCFQMLIYPVTDARMKTESMKQYKDTPLWNSVNNRKMWELYLANAAPQEKAFASPMQNELPRQIPNTYIETAEFDCLHDEGIAYAKKLGEAGAKVEVHETKGTIHGFDAAANSNFTKGRIKKRVEALRKAFGN